MFLGIINITKKPEIVSGQVYRCSTINLFAKKKDKNVQISFSCSTRPLRLF
jgi:hypothetical protein